MKTRRILAAISAACAMVTARLSNGQQRADAPNSQVALPQAQVTPPIVDLGAGANQLGLPQLTAPAGTATFNPGTATSTAITVTPLGNAMYSPGYAHITVAGGATEGYFALSGFSPADSEVFALRLLVDGTAPTEVEINRIVGDINQYDSESPAAATTPSEDAALGGSYDLLVTIPPPFYNQSNPVYFEFDFATETTVSGITVTDVAASSAIPEPATLVMVAPFAILLSGRTGRRHCSLPSKSARFLSEKTPEVEL
jgi:hypothetical protein